jgi:enoyl-CoA hydratase/carnithine racemase
MSSGSHEIDLVRTGCVLHIRLDRTDKGNVITLHEGMTNALVDDESDEAIRVMLFSGAGDSFCGQQRSGRLLFRSPE